MSKITLTYKDYCIMTDDFEAVEKTLRIIAAMESAQIGPMLKPSDFDGGASLVSNKALQDTVSALVDYRRVANDLYELVNQTIVRLTDPDTRERHADIKSWIESQLEQVSSELYRLSSGAVHVMAGARKMVYQSHENKESEGNGRHAPGAYFRNVYRGIAQDAIQLLESLPKESSRTLAGGAFEKTLSVLKSGYETTLVAEKEAQLPMESSPASYFRSVYREMLASFLNFVRQRAIETDVDSANAFRTAVFKRSQEVRTQFDLLIEQETEDRLPPSPGADALKEQTFVRDMRDALLKAGLKLKGTEANGWSPALGEFLRRFDELLSMEERLYQEMGKELPVR